MSAPTTRAETAPRFGWTRWNWDKTFRGVRSALVTREALAYAALVGTALALRLVDLSSRAFHHDESQHGYFSWLFSTGHGYHYDPILHGPLRDLITGSLFFLFGDGDFTARLGSALFGSLLVALPFCCAGSSAGRPPSPPPYSSASVPRTSITPASSARTSTWRRSRSR